MATIQGTIQITAYTARLEQAITSPTRTPSYVLSMQGIAERGLIRHALLYFDVNSPKYGDGDVSPGFRIRAFLAKDDYQQCLDMLRNEEPVYFSYQYDGEEADDLIFPGFPRRDAKLLYYGLHTRSEPVGEEES